MARDDDGEHTRFPCLATLRSLLATVVTVLAVAVVVRVTVVFNRPEDIRLSISGGYIKSEQQWWTEKTTPSKYPRDMGDPLPVGSGGDAQQQTQRRHRSIGVIPDTIVGSFGDYGEPVVTMFPPTTPVELRVRWSAYNPNGRGPIECNVTAIGIFDMPSTSSTSTGMEIGRILLEKPVRFSVPPMASHTDTQWVTIDNDTLQYIYNQYVGKSSFGAMVQVTATTTSKTPLSTSVTDDILNYYCWPVTVVYGTPDETAHGDVNCRTDNPANISSRAPAPAPAGDAAELPAGINYLHG